MIEAKGLSKFYSGTRAIDDVSFKIAAGEVVGLLGLNGAGKSTILKMLGSFLMPTKGDAFVGGFSTSREPEKVREIIGYLPDTPPLYDEMTTEGYLDFVARLKNVPAAEVAAKVATAMSKTSLDAVAGTCLGNLSHGFRQRVGIAQAIVHNPAVLILDEPINGLDPIQIVEMRDLILALKGEHTIILSSHILSEITQTCDRILIINNGKLAAEGSQAELATEVMGRQVVSVSVGRTAGNLVDVIGRVDGVESVELSGGERYLVRTGRDVRAGIAKAVVDSGNDLIGLERVGDGLESVFMELVRGKGSV